MSNTAVPEDVSVADILYGHHGCRLGRRSKARMTTKLLIVA